MGNVTGFLYTYPLNGAIHQINRYTVDNATGFPYTYPLNGAIHQINRYTVDKYYGNQLHLLLSVVYALKDNRKTSKCCHRLHRREWIFSGKTNLDLSLAYHDFQ